VQILLDTVASGYSVTSQIGRSQQNYGAQDLQGGFRVHGRNVGEDADVWGRHVGNKSCHTVTKAAGNTNRKLFTLTYIHYTHGIKLYNSCSLSIDIVGIPALQLPNGGFALRRLDASRHRRGNSSALLDEHAHAPLGISSDAT
jgi:hypothetical protein